MVTGHCTSSVARCICHRCTSSVCSRRSAAAMRGLSLTSLWACRAMRSLEALSPRLAMSVASKFRVGTILNASRQPCDDAASAMGMTGTGEGGGTPNLLRVTRCCAAGRFVTRQLTRAASERCQCALSVLLQPVAWHQTQVIMIDSKGRWLGSLSLRTCCLAWGADSLTASSRCACLLVKQYRAPCQQPAHARRHSGH